MCWVVTRNHTHTHTHSHVNRKTIDLGQGWGSFSCLLKPWLYWVAGVASPFHTVNLLEGFFLLLRSCSHNSDLNLFLGTFFVAAIWQTRRCIGSFLRKILLPLFFFFKLSKQGNELLYPIMSHIICLNSFHRNRGLTYAGILSNNYKKLSILLL